MHIKDTIKKIYAAGISMKLEGDILRVKAPDGAMTNEIISLIRDNKEAIKLILAEDDEFESVEDGFSTENRHEMTWSDVSFLQRNIWLSDSINGDSNANYLQAAFHLKGHFCVKSAEKSILNIICRHHVLRTTYAEKNGDVLQFVHVESPFRISERSLSSASPAELQQIVLDIQNARFDLQCDPVVRVCHLSLCADEALLLFTMHHIASDGLSLELFVEEFMAGYQATLSGQPIQLPELPIQYADYALWQNLQLSGGRLAQELSYWQQQLAAALPVSALPTDFPRGPVRQGTTDTYYSSIPGHIVSSLETLARQYDMTLFMLLHAAFALLLAKQSNQNRVTVGTPVAGRLHESVGASIGCFANTVVLATNTAFENLLDYLSNIRQVHIGAQAHQSVPFDKLVEQAGIETSLGFIPWIQHTIQLRQDRVKTLVLPGVTITPYAAQRNRTLVDIDLSVVQSGSQLRCHWTYDTSLFTAQTIKGLEQKFLHLLEKFVFPDGLPLHQWNLLSTEEIRQFTQVSTLKNAAQYQLLHQGLERQVSLTPDSVAIDHHGQQITYNELNRSANQLAVLLRDNGIGPEHVVAVLLERSIEAVIAIVAILKAGGAFMPLDPAMPETRMRHILQDSGATLVLSKSEYLRETDVNGCRVLCIDAVETKAAVDAASAQNLHLAEILPHNLAYIIYTSGSTGEPKGVEVEHRHIVHQNRCEIEEFDFRPGDRTLHLIAFSFDPAIAHLFGPLNAGSTVYLTNPDAGVAALMQREGITHASFPASVLASLEPLDLPDLRLVTAGAEKCPMPVAATWAEGRRFLYCYGPTETTVVATWGEFCGNGITAMMGKPLPGVCCYVLNEHQQPVAAGGIGELYIGGAGVARGYRNNPQLTAQRFITNPVTANVNDRVYRTGDMVRQLPDGNLEFLGRVDLQIKMNGYRIELGEIENALIRQPEVRSAVVQYVQQEQRQQLIAYFTASQPRKIQEVWPSVAEFNVLDDVMYRSMEENTDRVSAYQQAFSQHLHNKTVLEVGTGPGLVLTRLALNAGASHIYSVEINEAAYQKAKKLLTQWPDAERVTLILGDATQVVLPELVDFCISSIVGSIASSQGAEVILDGVRHHLKSSNAMLPQRAVNTLYAVDLSHYELAFSALSAHYTNKIFEQNGGGFDLRLCLKDMTPEVILSEGALFEEINFTAEMQREKRHDISLSILRDGMITGLLVSLKLFIDEQHWIDNLIHQRGLLPVYLSLPGTGLEVYAGDLLTGVVQKEGVSGSLHTDYQLSICVWRMDEMIYQATLTLPHQSAAFRASTLYEQLFTDSVPKVFHANALAESVKRKLSNELPSYMVPQHFIELPSLPLTSHGKIDRAALPSIDTLKIQSNCTPLDQTIEYELAEIWSKLLGVEKVELYKETNFFTCGGHSLLAVRLVNEIKTTFNIHIDIKQIFGQPEISAMAQVIKDSITIRLIEQSASHSQIFSEGVL